MKPPDVMSIGSIQNPRWTNYFNLHWIAKRMGDEYLMQRANKAMRDIEMKIGVYNGPVGNYATLLRK